MFSRFVIIFELILVSVGILIADRLQSHFSIIPKSIVRLPEVSYSRADFWTVFKFFLVVHFLCFLAIQWRLGAWRPSDPQRTADELFTLATAFALSALGVFITTSVSFDPNFVASIAVYSALLLTLTSFIFFLKNQKPAAGAFAHFFRSIFRRMFSVPGILALTLALSPAILAKLFTSDRDVANAITQVRIFFSDSTRSEYSLINLFGDMTFQQPMLVKNVPNKDHKLFVLERSGRLFSVDYPNALAKSLILDIRDKVGVTEVENGALGFAFHPDYGRSASANRNFIYLYYTSVHDGQQTNHLSRFDLSLADIQQRRASEVQLMVLPREPSGFHNGGSVEFGPNGFLYIALGEGVHPKGVTSLSESLRQGILRIDVDQSGGDISHPIQRSPMQSATQNYFIPNDNPFLGEPSILEEYWAIGLRNPFRMAFDIKTNNLWVGDVGSTEWEEVNLVMRGGNYQFPYMEGYKPGSTERPNVVFGSEQPPLYTYIHTAFDRAVIGGTVYRGTKFKELQGMYVFSDNYSSKIFAMSGEGTPVTEVGQIAQADQFAQRGISSVGELADGSLIVTLLGRAGSETGEVLALTQGSIQKSTMPKPEISSPSELSEADITEIFTTNCSRCHDKNGTGNGPDAKLLGVHIADFTTSGYNNKWSDEELQIIITKGGAAVGLSPLMPPWSPILDDNEIEGLVRYIRKLETK